MSGYAIKGTRIVLLTTISQVDNSVEYLSKPVCRDRLINSIMEALNNIQGMGIDGLTELRKDKKEPEDKCMPRILLAEDDIINRKVAVEMLKRRGLSCDIAENGKEAYKLCFHKDFDIIFMDCQMPVMDGYESTAKIRELEGSMRHTPIIAMTAYAMEGDRKKCIDTGMDDHISKPLDFEAVLRLIEEYTVRSKTDHFEK